MLLLRRVRGFDRRRHQHAHCQARKRGYRPGRSYRRAQTARPLDGSRRAFQPAPAGQAVPGSFRRPDTTVSARPLTRRENASAPFCPHIWNHGSSAEVLGTALVCNRVAPVADGSVRKTDAAQAQPCYPRRGAPGARQRIAGR